MKSEEFFREVNEELQRDRLLALWKGYGSYLIAAAVLVVVGTAAGVGWRAWEGHAAEAEAARYEAAAEGLDSDPAAAAARLGTFASGAATGYGELARLREAQAKAAAKDEPGAIAALDRLAGDQAADALLRDLATVLAAARELETADPAQLKVRLEPMAVAGAPYRFTARELLALLALRTGDTASARKALDDLTHEVGLPPQQEQRVRQLLASLGGSPAQMASPATAPLVAPAAAPPAESSTASGGGTGTPGVGATPGAGTSSSSTPAGSDAGGAAKP